MNIPKIDYQHYSINNLIQIVFVKLFNIEKSLN